MKLDHKFEDYLISMTNSVPDLLPQYAIKPIRELLVRVLFLILHE